MIIIIILLYNIVMLDLWQLFCQISYAYVKLYALLSALSGTSWRLQLIDWYWLFDCNPKADLSDRSLFYSQFWVHDRIALEAVTLT